MELFKSPVIHRNDLFQSHVVKQSGLSKYRPIMTKQQAYSKLSRGTKNIDALLDDRRAQINVLERKQRKTPFRASRYNVAISRLKAENDALQAEKDKHRRDQEDLIRFTTAYAGKVIPSDAITAFVAGKTPLPYRLTAPEQVPNANTISAPELGGPIFQPTSQPLLTGGEASGPLPSIGAGAVPFQPSGSQVPVEDQTGQGTPEAVESSTESPNESDALTKAQAEESEGFGPNYPSDSGLPMELVRGSNKDRSEKREAYKRRYRKRMEQVLLKNKNYEFIPEKEENEEGEVEPVSQTEPEKSESSEKEPESEAEPEPILIKDINKMLNAKPIEKYLKAYRIKYLKRNEYTGKQPYKMYLNGLVKDDPEFLKYHNVVKKK